MTLFLKVIRPHESQMVTKMLHLDLSGPIEYIAGYTESNMYSKLEMPILVHNLPLEMDQNGC